MNSGPFSGVGISSDVDSTHPRATSGVSRGNLVEGNVVEGSIQGRSPGNVVNNDNLGIRLEPGNTGNFILNNRVRNNGLDGITLFQRHTFTTVRDNISTENGSTARHGRRDNGIGLPIGGANDNIVENKPRHPQGRQRHLGPQRLAEERGPEQTPQRERCAAGGIGDLRVHVRPARQQPELRRQRLARQPLHHRLPGVRRDTP